MQKSKLEPNFDFLDQLKDVNVKILLFHETKYVPNIKIIKELWLKKPPIVHMVAQLVVIMLGRVIIPKYTYPSSLCDQCHHQRNTDTKYTD